MSWTGPKELKAQLVQLWERGELLRDLVSGNTRFPLRLTLKSPTSADITDRFEAVRNWVAELTASDILRIEWREVQHRVQGAQKLPVSVWIETIDDALRWLGKHRERERFNAQLYATQQSHPAIMSWLERRPMRALELSAEWPRLMAVVSWLIAHPRPGIYLRQVDLPGIHSKFIEHHRNVLIELLDLALPVGAINHDKVGTSQFAARYGFLDKPLRIRFRLLDSTHQLIADSTDADVTLDAKNFSCLSLGVTRAFITENEINFLAFPPVRHAIVIFGAGYGWEALSRTAWLNKCSIHYWGDIDTHGFGILNQLRSAFDHVESFLMDRATLDAHALVWGVEDKPLLADLHRLTPEERALYDDLRDNRLRTGLRLEQEHIGFHWLKRELEKLVDNDLK